MFSDCASVVWQRVLGITHLALRSVEFRTKFDDFELDVKRSKKEIC